MLTALLTGACQVDHPPVSSTVGGRLELPGSTPSTSAAARSKHKSPDGPRPAATETVAWVNGRAISASRFNELLFQSQGLSALEQLISLELVKSQASRDQVSVSEADVEAEYDRSLEELARSVVDQDDLTRLRAIGEQVLQDFLRKNNFSLAEYGTSVERNAYLRKLIEVDITINDEEVREEFTRRYGRRAVVRHIVVPDLAAVAEMRKQLEAGADFAELARSHSIHRISGSAGGLLPPFTEGDSQVPGLLRQVAFSLKPGEASSAVNIDGQYHLVRLERFIEPENQALSPSLSVQLRLSLQGRKTRQAMQNLERRLFEQADIRIENPTLRRQFDDKHRNDQTPNR